MMQPKIAVTIPAFKGQYLGEAIKSVLSQSYSDFELIIVDDCSPEDLFSIVSSFKDDRIRYFRNDNNCGSKDVVLNWNICLSYCTGDYVVCIGDDDKLMPCCLEEYVKLINKYPILNVFHAKTQLIDEKSIPFCMQESRSEFETAHELIYNVWSYKRQQFIGDFLYKVEWLRTNGGYCNFPYAFSSDWVTAFSAAKNKGIANGQQFMFQYRISRYTISVAGNKTDKVYACKQVWDWYKQSLKDTPINSNDKLYWELVSNNLDIYFQDTERKLIFSDIKNEGWKFLYKLFYWLQESKNVGLSKSAVFKTFLKNFNYILLGINFPER